MQAASLTKKLEKKRRGKKLDTSQTEKCELLLIVITGDYLKMLWAVNIHTLSQRRKGTVK